MASSDSQIDKPQRGRPKRAELPDVNINTGAQSINSKRASRSRLLFGTSTAKTSLVSSSEQEPINFISCNSLFQVLRKRTQFYAIVYNTCMQFCVLTVYLNLGLSWLSVHYPESTVSKGSETNKQTNKQQIK